MGGGVEGGAIGGNQFPTFDAEFKFAKIQNPMLRVGGGWEVGGNQSPTFDAEFKFAKIQNPMLRVGEWVGEGGWVGRWNQFPSFNADSKFAKIQNSHVQEGGVGGTNFQLLMLSPNLLKSKIPMSGGGRGVEAISNF